MSLSKLEEKILLSKGLTEEQIVQLDEAGIASKADFSTIGDAQTLSDITDLSAETAEKVMQWALGVPASSSATAAPVLNAGAPIIIDGADVVYCQHCTTKQPKDYQSGDLCPSCGKQAETMSTCHWCGNVGPGKFCRGCGSEFVGYSELELALQLRREGNAKDDISLKLKAMSDSDKQILWSRIKARG